MLSAESSGTPIAEIVMMFGGVVGYHSVFHNQHHGVIDCFLHHRNTKEPHIRNGANICGSRRHVLK